MAKRGAKDIVSLDIIERKRAEEALRESEEQYRDLLENANDLIQSVTPDGHFLYVNKAWRKALGYSEEEIANLELWDIVHPDSILHCREVFQKTMSGKTVNGIEAVFVVKDGKSIAVEGNANCRFEGGKPVATRGIFRGITERKRAEETIRKEKERAEQYLGIAGVMLVTVNTDENITLMNSKGCEILGYKEGELIGKNWFDTLVPKRVRDEIRSVFRRLMAGDIEPVEYYENPLLTKDGGERLIAFHNAVVRDSNGQIVGALFSADDITERKQAENSLRESEGKLNAMLQSIGDHMSMMDKDLNIIWANETAKKLFGNDIIGKKCYEAYHRRKEPCEPYPCITLKAFQDGGTHEHETEVIGEDGEIIYFHCTASVALRDKEGEPTAAIEISRDITEHKRAQQELQEKNEQLDTQNEELQSQRQELVEKTRELEAASRAKSEFLSSMSHELRTPLNAVIGFSELMIDGIPGEINDEQKRCLSDIWNSGQHLLNLINDVLDLSKVEAGKMELKLGNLNLADAINDAAQTVKPMLDKNRHQLAVNIEKGLPQVRADKSRIRQILLNLLSNAIKSTPPGGELAIDASREGDWGQVSVVDNGIGIKKDDQEQIFEAFTQAEALPDRRKEGTGLGLALTKQFVEAIGGRVWLESEYGKGSKFTFTVPFAKEGKPYLEREGNK